MQRRTPWLVTVAIVIAMPVAVLAADPPPSASAPPAATPPGGATPAPASPQAPATEPGTPPAPAANAKPSSGRFEPTEKIRADFDVSFPVDI
ncbi:MAG: hypothetical protein U1F08_01620 [Steroidobacteraceae bacterium]